MAYSFTWNGTSCLTKGIRLRTSPEIVRPEERVSHIVIPGRSGELTKTEGDDIYNSYIQTLQMIADSPEHLAEAEQWLRGDGYVTFSTQPNVKQRARVINSVTFTKLSHNMDRWAGDVQFYCDPLKEQLEEEAVEITTNGATVTNPGDVVSRPKITITGSGDITIRIRSNSIALTAADTGWIVDSDLQWITNASGTPQMGVYTGNFPVIPPGESTVQFTGSVTKLTIEGKWRYL